MIESPKNSEQLRENIDSFFNAYNTLTQDGKVSFLVALDKSIKGKTDREKKMYIALLKAARDEKSIDQAIDEMGKADKGKV